MNREIIFYENYFLEFYQTQDEKVKEKIKYVLELIKQVESNIEEYYAQKERTRIANEAFFG